VLEVENSHKESSTAKWSFSSSSGGQGHPTQRLEHLKTSSLPILITKDTSSWRWNQCIFATLLPWRSLIPRFFLPWDPNCKVPTRSKVSTLPKSYSWTNYLDMTYLPNLQPVKYECITFWTQHYHTCITFNVYILVTPNVSLLTSVKSHLGMTIVQKNGRHFKIIYNSLHNYRLIAYMGLINNRRMYLALKLMSMKHKCYKRQHVSMRKAITINQVLLSLPLSFNLNTKFLK
jgi:hypothetical protein